MKTILVTGASRGIGLSIVRQLLRDGERVMASCRNPTDAPHLVELSDQYGDRLSLHALDVADPASVERLSQSLAGERIDTLINNAGLLGGHHQTFHDMDFAAWENVFRTNTLGPFRVSQALYPNLKLSDAPTIATISSELGSSVWPTGGLYIYASSKGGLNRVIQMMAIDLKEEGFCVVAIHPGLVKTDMAGEVGQIEPEESAAGVCRVIAGLGREDSGKFYQWNGSYHAW